MNIVSFSLYGGIEKYDIGAVENARLMPEIYPDWVMRVYCDAQTTSINTLIKLGCEVHVMECDSNGHSGMFWRFYAVNEVDYVVFRDCDSRINVREKAAVNAWLDSGKGLHVMMDHPHHVQRPINGGMWGIRKGVIPDFHRLMAAWKQKQQRVDDMRFLQKVVWPLMVNNHLAHVSCDSVYGGVPFPLHAPYAGFVGEQINAMPIR